VPALASTAEPQRAKQRPLPPLVVHAPRTDAIYNCHAYLTKVPVGAIKPFIETFTEPGERVLDMFAGSGMTSLAAAMAGRVGVMSDISVLGQHIARGYLTQVNPAALRSAARAAVDRDRRREAHRGDPDDLVVRVRLPGLRRAPRLLRAPG
jgi:methylase of polypeptide subunit release factors